MSGKVIQFLRGVGSVMDIFPTRPHPIEKAVHVRTDADAIRGDWERVGLQLRGAMSWADAQGIDDEQPGQAGAAQKPAGTHDTGR